MIDVHLGPFDDGPMQVSSILAFALAVDSCGGKSSRGIPSAASKVPSYEGERSPSHLSNGSSADVKSRLNLLASYALSLICRRAFTSAGLGSSKNLCFGEPVRSAMFEDAFEIQEESLQLHN
ncbi:hypothetical protein OUZ56_033626 [Daphnia magna]|uniref:Uncharacterized protein n=1 Tax=Daphnia magna TaxID=35525 RepID=A0ABQ9ZY38_9CRUS|nr:hypothetical protein OUZ56_033626 [Daphnia magna]